MINADSRRLIYPTIDLNNIFDIKKSNHWNLSAYGLQ